MNLTPDDISNLDKIVFGLSQHLYDTVPELLNGWQKFPHPLDPIDQKYRFYENVLICNNICRVKESWTSNSVISGFMSLQLDTKGFYLVSENESVQRIFEESEKPQIESLSIHIKKFHMGDKFSNNKGTFINKSTIKNSLNNIYQALSEDDLKTIEHISREVGLSGNKDAIENMEAFHEEVQNIKPKSSVLKSLWNGVVSAVPKLLTSTEKVVTIIDKVGQLSHD